MTVSVFNQFIGLFAPYNRINTPVILQLSETECGIAALAIMLSYYGTSIPIEKLREMCGSSRDGCKATMLMAVAREFGFNADAYRVDCDELLTLRQPVIAFWNFNHYIVINGFGKGKVFINDPATGPVTVSLKAFDKAFTGVILVISPSRNAIKVKPNPVFFPLVKEWLNQYRVELLFIVACLLLGLICPLLNASLSKLFVDYCVTAVNVDWIPYLGLLGVICSFIYCFASFLQKWTEFKLCTKASILKTAALTTRLLRLPLIFYALRQKSEIITLLSQAEMIINLLCKSLTKFLINLLSIAVCLLMMKKISITLFSASILLSGLSCYLFYIIAKLSLSQEKVNIHTTSKYQAYSMSTTRNIETIKASGLERHVLGKWRNLLARKLSIQEKTNTYTLLIEASGKFFDYVAMVTLFILGGIQVAQGYLSIGYLMAYYSLHLFYCSNLTGLLQAIKDAQVAYVSHLRVNTIFCYEEESRFKHASLHPSHNSPTITCQNLTFYYNKTVQPTLQNITIHIKPYQQIALVGSTGSGKSTLAKILCALYQPHTGTMAINGNDVTTLSPQELAGLFAYVSQDVSLFAGTLYENLTLWEKNIPTQRIERAIHTACLNELIASRTLTSKVSENGNNFSQGEKQRIDIARALIQNAEVLVLDEATAALDVQTEKQLIANLCTINKTIIYVAHRLSTIQHCDQILVMKNGIIVESGNHDKLLRQKSHYYELIENERGTHSACQ